MAVLINYYEPMDLDYLEANLPTVEGMPSGVYNKERACAMDWRDIAKYQKLTPDFIERHMDKLPLDIILKRGILSKEFVMKYKDKFPMSFIDKSYTLTAEEILELESRIVNDDPNHRFILNQRSHSQSFIEEFMNRHMDKLSDWHFYNHEFSLEFIEKFLKYRDEYNKVNMHSITLPDVENLNRCLIAIVSHQPVVNDDVLERWIDDGLSWGTVSEYGNITTDFIERYADAIEWDLLYDNETIKLPDEFIDKHADRFTWEEF